MKNITLRKDGRYMGRKQINEKIFYAYAKTMVDCAKKLKKEIKNHKQIKKREDNSYFLFQWIDLWFNTYKKPFIKKETAQQIKYVINFLKENFKNTQITKITTEQIQTFLNGIITSRKKEFIILYFKSALQKAEDLNYIQKNPFKAIVKEPKLNVIRNGYNLEEQKTILKIIKNTEIENIILFYLITGVRKNEITTIDLNKDLDIKNKTIKILSEKKRNKNIYRTIDLSDKMINIILNNKNMFYEFKTDYIYRKFKELLKPYKINAGLHKLRHTFATNHFYLGTPIKLISSWLGHTTIELTQNIYTHIDRTITKNDILKLYNNLYFKF